MIDLATVEQHLRNAADCLAHSAQSDGVIERDTALWLIAEARESADTIARLRADLAEAVEALRPFAVRCDDHDAPEGPRRADSFTVGVAIKWLRRARSIVNRHPAPKSQPC